MQELTVSNLKMEGREMSSTCPVFITSIVMFVMFFSGCSCESMIGLGGSLCHVGLCGKTAQGCGYGPH